MNEDSQNQQNGVQDNVVTGKLVKNVTFNDINSMCKETIIMLINKNIPLIEALNTFEKKKNANSNITQKAIQNILQQKPFERKPNEAELMARYCVEENSSSKVIVDPLRSIDFDTFKSIMRQLLGCYELINMERATEKFLQIQKLLLKKKRNIIETF